MMPTHRTETHFASSVTALSPRKKLCRVSSQERMWIVQVQWKASKQEQDSLTIEQKPLVGDYDAIADEWEPGLMRLRRCALYPVRSFLSHKRNGFTYPSWRVMFIEYTLYYCCIEVIRPSIIALGI